MLRAHSLVPFKDILGMRDDEYERIVEAAQSELAERGESARIYIKVSVLLEASEETFADLTVVQARCLRTEAAEAIWCRLFPEYIKLRVTRTEQASALRTRCRLIDFRPRCPLLESTQKDRLDVRLMRGAHTRCVSNV
jgi:hypothetical protein